MIDFLSHIAFWHWWILAVALAIIEIIAPGVFFIWLAGAAVLTGVIALVLPNLGWEAETLVFAVLAIISIIAWQRIGRRLMRATNTTTLNQRGAQLIGRTVSLTEPIINGRGTARINDTVWRVEGADMPAGSVVKVTGVDGTILKVERASPAG
ncbi:NfeD family protein [Dongia soli]|uniref:NfeD family protein n=1 Tax=Dongia soli TaxID=600628 RepID=A0ABU5E5U2_9PROT|nr:NfeD family protein [Dongia soli]MDY0881680.1 NfeD family protein [Dongia soli]